ncbi:hypothetical protein [Psychromonas arctica]|uniref:hypothetical protein n=1 Tax=Psychromonas arctica TaxID=168275 RepID=UPI002FD0B21E
MNTLKNTILSMSKLIAYYPLNGTGKEESGNYNDLLKYGDREHFFNSLPLTKDLTFSYAIDQKENFDFGYLIAGYLYTVQPTNTKCLTMFARLRDTSDYDDFAGLFTFNGATGEENIDYRFFSQVTSSGDLYITDGLLNNSVELKDTGVNLSEYFDKIFLFTIQETSNSSGIEVYINDILIFSRNTGNGFATLQNHPTRWFVPACHTYMDNQSQVATDASDVCLFNDRLTIAEISLLSSFLVGDVSINNIKANNFIFSNKETRSQANPQPDVLQYLKQSQLPKLATKQGNYSSSIDQEGNPRAMGYYESKVLIQGSPAANRKVMCLTQYGQLLDEVYSSDDGTYRFDYLLLDTKYLFVALDNQLTTNTPPDYAAVAADWQTPIPYKE